MNFEIYRENSVLLFFQYVILLYINSIIILKYLFLNLFKFIETVIRPDAFEVSNKEPI